MKVFLLDSASQSHFFVASRNFVLESVMEYLAAHRVFLVHLGLNHHASVDNAKIAWFNNPRHTPGRHAA